MAAVFAGARGPPVLAGAEGVVVISGVNAPDEVIVSGERDAVRSLCGRLAVDGIRAEPLTVSHAFHSPLMQPMISDFSDAARSVARTPRRLRIVSSVTGELADEAWGGPDYWVRQILAPVRFADAMRSVIAAGADVVVEIGPHPVLTALGRRSMPDSEVRWLPTLRRERDDLAARRDEIEARALESDRRRAPKPPASRCLSILPAHATLVDEGVREARWARSSGVMVSSTTRRASRAGGARGRLPGRGRPYGASQRARPPHRRTHRVACCGNRGDGTAAARECFGAGPLEVVDLQLLAPVLLPDEGTVPLQTVITASAATIAASCSMSPKT
jgi:hypothetical protein